VGKVNHIRPWIIGSTSPMWNRCFNFGDSPDDYPIGGYTWELIRETIVWGGVVPSTWFSMKQLERYDTWSVCR
jgi:hypothetical protein